MISRPRRSCRLLAAAMLSLLTAHDARSQPRLPATAERPAAPRRLAAPATAARDAGERFYLRGLNASGVAVAATVQRDIHVKSSEMACINCHRRSAMGSAEGNIVVPAIDGATLFAARTLGAPQIGPPRTTGDGTRPAYTDDTLLRALRDGVDPTGRQLSPAMPRYSVTAADASAIATYLRGIGRALQPGVSEAIVHVATIVTPRVTPERRASMIEVLRTFIRAKNGGTRYETRRRTSGGWDMKQQYETYREWVLDEWELHGSPAEWPAQLEELYRRQPVYAIVGGIAEEDWSPIDAFCDRHKIPAVLPQTPLPPAVPAGDGFYSLYFSKGVELEAHAVAHHLEKAATPVVQVARCGSAGRAAAAMLARAYTNGALPPTCVPADTPMTADTWRSLIGDAARAVVWLDGSDRAALDALADSGAAAKVTDLYLSSTLLGAQMLRLREPLLSHAIFAHPYVPPDQFDRHAIRSLGWMKANGIVPADPRVAVNTLFAVTLAADALSRPRTLESREYFVETIEHMTSRSPYPTAYPSVTLGPARRFASAGAYLLGMPQTPGEPFRRIEEWYVAK
jgi:hypothetical protein